MKVSYNSYNIRENKIRLIKINTMSIADASHIDVDSVKTFSRLNLFNKTKMFCVFFLLNNSEKNISFKAVEFSLVKRIDTRKLTSMSAFPHIFTEHKNFSFKGKGSFLKLSPFIEAFETDA